MMIVRHLVAILLLPFTVTIVIPVVIVSSSGITSGGWSLPSPLNLVPTIAGVLVIALGLVLIYQTVRMFMTIGQGTIAPWDATRKLIVQGVYRYVRNPMISGVIAILLGESLVLGSVPLLLWFAFAVVVNAIYIPFVEEPGLEDRFGDEYRLYKANVPRWLPRLKPWIPMNIDKRGS